MINKHIIKTKDLKPFGSVKTISEQAKALVLQQQSTWLLAKNNYEGLKQVQNKSFDFNHFKIAVQYNPERIRSTAAKTDKKSIKNRPCFLCVDNLPPEQKGFLLLEKYLVLTNPFPIFPYHLTISSLTHTPQLIYSRIDDLLEISRLLPGFTIFYNGPQCGASAPDHFHFQAAGSGFIPVEKEIDINSIEIQITEKTKILFSKNYLRNFISIDSSDLNELQNRSTKIFKALESLNQQPEPMLNILCKYVNNRWQLIFFPREKQRPFHFFKNGIDQIIVGPASVEMGGLIILPRKEDYNKIIKNNIIEIYKDVSLNNHSFEKINRLIKETI